MIKKESRKVIVTGADGFVGRYVISSLQKHGYETVQISHRTLDLCRSFIPDTGDEVEAVIHLAAKTFVPESWDDPMAYLGNNTEMLLRVLEFCRKRGTKLLFPSTYLYGSPQYLPIDERHPCVPVTPYHMSKKVGEELCEFYSENYDVPVAVIRPFNVYGFGQREEFLLPKIFKQVYDKNSNVIEVYDLAPKRDYLYVEDFAEIMVDMIPYICGFDVYNIGGGHSYSVKEVIDIIQSECGTKKQISELHHQRRNEINDCVSDNSKIDRVLGGISVTALRCGIQKWKGLQEKV